MINNPEKTIIRTLGDGLILRRSTREDAGKIFEFNAMIHGENGPDDRIGEWARDLIEKPHPTFGVGDFTIVEEESSGKIVSSLNHISQTWSYAGIPIRVGRPELVGTLPEYRNRGLVRTQFEEIHRWSQERGEMMQVITGIPYYYRLYGYEMCVDLDGSRSGFEMNVPKLKENEAEAFRFRSATRSDIPFMSELYTQGSQRGLLAAIRDEKLWQLELDGRNPRSIQRLVYKIIERVEDGEAVGFLAHPWFSWDVSCPVQIYELKQGVSWLDVTPAVVRHMWEVGQSACESEGRKRSAFTFSLATNHPVFEVMRDNLPRKRDPYCWYIRVPDLPGFMRQIAPALEARLETSLIPGYSGEVKLSFYRDGLRLVFEKGKLSTAESWRPDPKNWGDASFPGLSFLRLLFGDRSLDELEQTFADCFWNGDGTRMLLTTMFPKQPSLVLGIA